MDRLWAPWRKAYIRPKRKLRGCLFCRLLREKSQDSRNFVLKRARHSFAVLNLYPYNNGHVMIVPNRHVADLSRLTDAEKLDWLELYESVQRAIAKTLRPDGFNVGINLGKAAGAGVPGHLHLHTVPRWNGDTNFMPVVAESKVISEALSSAWKVLKKELK